MHEKSTFVWKNYFHYDFLRWLMWPPNTDFKRFQNFNQTWGIDDGYVKTFQNLWWMLKKNLKWLAQALNSLHAWKINFCLKKYNKNMHFLPWLFKMAYVTPQHWFQAFSNFYSCLGHGWRICKNLPKLFMCTQKAFEVISRSIKLATCMQNQVLSEKKYNSIYFFTMLS